MLFLNEPNKAAQHPVQLHTREYMAYMRASQQGLSAARPHRPVQSQTGGGR